jgi:hypothetical protein
MEETASAHVRIRTVRARGEPGERGVELLVDERGELAVEGPLDELLDLLPVGCLTRFRLGTVRVSRRFVRPPR